MSDLVPIGILFLVYIVFMCFLHHLHRQITELDDKIISQLCKTIAKMREAWAQERQQLRDQIEFMRIHHAKNATDATAESEDPADWWKREERTKDQGPRTN